MVYLPLHLPLKHSQMWVNISYNIHGSYGLGKGVFVKSMIIYDKFVMPLHSLTGKISVVLSREITVGHHHG